MLRLDELAEKFVTSAESLFSASSNDILVLVEFSKNKFKIFFPLNVGTFFTGLSRTSLNDNPVSISFMISSFGVSFNEIKCLLLSIKNLSPNKLNLLYQFLLYGHEYVHY